MTHYTYHRIGDRTGNYHTFDVSFIDPVQGIYRGVYSVSKLVTGNPNTVPASDGVEVTESECFATTEEGGAHGSELLCGTIVARPQRTGIGSLLLYHALSRSNVDCLHITDGWPGKATWRRVFEGIRLGDLTSDAEYYASRDAMLGRLSASLRRNRWMYHKPTIATVNGGPGR